ncbi:hypothetical protein HYV10_00370 [Candidatus Dependentiae bacterium]|nr:hypothetical protein [Candidatus Dependentiae bacterium]
MKKIIITLCLLSYISIFSSEHINYPEEDFALLQEAIEIVASMSDNIANLVIEHKNDTHAPELTKQECLALVQKMTSFVLIILKKQKLKKASRKIHIYTSENLKIELDHIAENIFYKITIG